MSGCGSLTDSGVVRDVLTAVDCNTRSFARLGYESLAAANSPFQAALTIALTIYVAVIGYRLLFGSGARLLDGPVIALKIGAVLALVTSWSLFQTLVFDLAERAPLQIAAVISAPMRGSQMAMDPVAGLQTAYDRLSQASNSFAHPPKSLPQSALAEYATASQTLMAADNALFVAGPGLIAVITIAIGLLTATGPLFIALFLFQETRGFFLGWVRALAASAFGLISTWSLTVLMLHAVQPWMDALSDLGANGLADARTAITAGIIVLVFSASQFALMVAGIMIGRGFRLPQRGRVLGAPIGASQTQSVVMPLDLISRPAQLAEQLARLGTQSAFRERTGALAASFANPRRDKQSSPPIPAHIGDLYRRPAVSADPRQI